MRHAAHRCEAGLRVPWGTATREPHLKRAVRADRRCMIPPRGPRVPNAERRTIVARRHVAPRTLHVASVARRTLHAVRGVSTGSAALQGAGVRAALPAGSWHAVVTLLRTRNPTAHPSRPSARPSVRPSDAPTLPGNTPLFFGLFTQPHTRHATRTRTANARVRAATCPSSPTRRGSVGACQAAAALRA